MGCENSLIGVVYKSFGRVLRTCVGVYVLALGVLKYLYRYSNGLFLCWARFGGQARIMSVALSKRFCGLYVVAGSPNKNGWG